MYTEKNKIRKSKRNLKTQKEMNAAFPQYDDRRNIMSAHRKPSQWIYNDSLTIIDKCELVNK
jgi:hypothetical protein